MPNPECFFDVTIDGKPAGRICFEASIYLKCLGRMVRINPKFLRDLQTSQICLCRIVALVLFAKAYDTRACVTLLL
jgi:hypothetical protein